jgi:hypothetical protein
VATVVTGFEPAVTARLVVVGVEVAKAEGTRGIAGNAKNNTNLHEPLIRITELLWYRCLALNISKYKQSNIRKAT